MHCGLAYKNISILGDSVMNTWIQFNYGPMCDTPVCAFQISEEPSKEDIPTFDEWKKQVMEVEKEKSKCIH